MRKCLIDTSTLIDVRNADKKPNAIWAQSTLRHLISYQEHHPGLTVSALTVFEFFNGFYRRDDARGKQNFIATVLPTWEVIYPDQAIIELGAQIHAALAKGQTIDLPDTLIAATAISRGLTLVNANTKHFPRVQAAGFPLKVENWRET